jgi:hypothetical protein
MCKYHNKKKLANDTYIDNIFTIVKLFILFVYNTLHIPTALIGMQIILKIMGQYLL